MWTKATCTDSLHSLPDGKLLIVKEQATSTNPKGSVLAGTLAPRSSTFASVDSRNCDQTTRPTTMQHQPLYDEDDAPWDEAILYSPPSNLVKLSVKISSLSSTEVSHDSPNNQPIVSSLPLENVGSPSEVHSPEATGSMTSSLKSKSKPKKRSKKGEIGNDPLECHQLEASSPATASILSEPGDSKDLPLPAVNTSSKSRSSSREKGSHKTSTHTSRRSTREILKDDSKKPLYDKDSKPREVLPAEVSQSVTPLTKSTRKLKIDTKLDRNSPSQEEQLMITKSKTKGNASRSIPKGGLNELRLSLSSNSSLVDQIPDLASSDTSESKDYLVEDYSLTSISGLMDSITSLESQSHDLRTKTDLETHGRKSRRNKKQQSEGSIVFPSALQTAASATLSASLNNSDDRSKGGMCKHVDAPKNRLIMESSLDPTTLEQKQQQTPYLQDLMPPLKRKTSKGSPHESKSNTINAAEILKKKILQMNEELRLKAFNGNSSNSSHSGEISLDQSLSSKSDHGITIRRASRSLSGNAEKLRQSLRSQDPSDSGDISSAPRRRRSLDGSRSRQRERIDTSTVKEVRRRLKLKGKDEESSLSNKGVSKSPKTNGLERSASVSGRSLSKSETNTISSLGQESTILTTDTDASAMATSPAPLKQGKNKPTLSKKSGAKESSKAASTLPPENNIDSMSSAQLHENATDDVKEATTASGKTTKSPKSHRRNKEAKPGSQTPVLPLKQRAHSFRVTDKVESIQKKEQAIRSRSQSPSRKGKRQPKSLLNPETLDAWQISQQQKHRVTPFPSVYCRRLDDDDDDDDLNPALLLPPAFRQLQVGQKPKSSRF